jgi:hypothetical protein
MGNSSTKGPKTNKTIQDGMNEYLSYGSCEMQGWRGAMVNLPLLRKML